MKVVLLGFLVIAVTACSGDTDGTKTSTSRPEVAESTTSVQQPGELPPEALDELGPTQQPASGGESTGPLGETELQIETDDGELQIGGGEIPESASAFPLPDDFELQLASETSTATGFSGVSAQPVDELADFFRASLPAAGFDITDDSAPTPAIVTLAFTGTDSEGDLALSEAPGSAGTTVIVTLSPLG